MHTAPQTHHTLPPNPTTCCPQNAAKQPKYAPALCRRCAPGAEYRSAVARAQMQHRTGCQLGPPAWAAAGRVRVGWHRWGRNSGRQWQQAHLGVLARTGPSSLCRSSTSACGACKPQDRWLGLVTQLLEGQCATPCALPGSGHALSSAHLEAKLLHKVGGCCHALLNGPRLRGEQTEGASMRSLI